MKEKLICFKTSKLAKEKGFNWNTLYYHATIDNVYCDSDDSKGYSGSDIPPNNWNESIGRKMSDGKIVELYSAPTQSQLQKWLRDEKQLNIIPPLYYSDYGYTCSVIRMNNSICYDTYEEALENELYNKLLTV